MLFAQGEAGEACLRRSRNPATLGLNSWMLRCGSWVHGTGAETHGEQQTWSSAALLREHQSPHFGEGRANSAVEEVDARMESAPCHFVRRCRHGTPTPRGGSAAATAAAHQTPRWLPAAMSPGRRSTFGSRQTSAWARAETAGIPTACLRLSFPRRCVRPSKTGWKPWECDRRKFPRL